MRSVLILMTGLWLMDMGCRTVPHATKDEIALRDKWAAQVPPTPRQQIIDDAERHSEWGEKLKLKFEIERFQKYLHEQGKKGKTTGPTTGPG